MRQRLPRLHRTSKRLRRVLPAGLLAVLAVTARAGPASAEVGAGSSPTSQAIAANAQFLEYAPPPATPGIVCLVDSGVDLNPDTNAAVVGAEAEVAGWGTGDGLAQVQPPVEGHPAGHGTQMAMVMAAPQNGWGMVGIAPTAVRVYSIRVVPPGQSVFPFSAYSYAINRCLQLRIRGNSAITVVNLSFGGTTTPPMPDRADLEDSVDTARQHGLNVVGAAGNDGGTLRYPAAYPSVFAVGAGDAGPGGIGVLCGFSNGDGLDAIAPGCNSVTGGIDQAFQDDGTPAFGFGTSQAAGITSAVLAAMRAYSPALSAAEVETCLTASEHYGGNIDVTVAFNDCGLESVVQAGRAAIPHAPPVQTTAGPAKPMPTALGPPLAAPRLGPLRVRRGRLRVTVLNRPSGALIEVRVLGRRRGRLTVLSRRTAAASSVTFRLRAAYAVQVRVVEPGSRRPSPWITRVIR